MQKYKIDKTKFCENSKTPRSLIRKIIIENNLIPYVCQICGQNHIWLGEETSLILDHVNGVHNDHRLDLDDLEDFSKTNLRWLCANCDSQSEFFRARNKGRKVRKFTHCISCGKKVGYYNQSGYCKRCFNENKKNR